MDGTCIYGCYETSFDKSDRVSLSTMLKRISTVINAGNKEICSPVSSPLRMQAIVVVTYIHVRIYENWLKAKLIQNLFAHSVVLMGSIHYHNVEVNRAPT
jgi:hypothetical protein